MVITSHNFGGISYLLSNYQNENIFQKVICMSIKIKEANSQELHITFDYDAAIVEKIKSIKGRSW